MQLGSKETENERFAHYLTKTYRKTASLMANSLKSVSTGNGVPQGSMLGPVLCRAPINDYETRSQVSLLAGAEELSDISYQYGRNLGLAFQLVDDLLDFVSSAEAMGKPTATDLKLGLATAPVLFACEKVGIRREYRSIFILKSPFRIAVPRTEPHDNEEVPRTRRRRKGVRAGAQVQGTGADPVPGEAALPGGDTAVAFAEREPVPEGPRGHGGFRPEPHEVARSESGRTFSRVIYSVHYVFYIRGRRDSVSISRNRRPPFPLLFIFN